MSSTAPQIKQALARVFVDSIDEALPLYERLVGLSEVRRSVSVASIWRAWAVLVARRKARGLFAGVIACAASIVLISGAPLGVIAEAVQALAGVLLPSASVFLLLLCNDREVLGPWRNRPWLNALSSVIVATLVLLALILMATTVFPNINVTTFALIGGTVLAVGLVGLAVLSLRSRREATAAGSSRQLPRFPGRNGQCHRSRCSPAPRCPPDAERQCSA